MTATSSANYDPTRPFTRAELDARFAQVEEDIRQGRTYPIDDLLNEYEMKFVQEKEEVDYLRNRAMKAYTEVLEGKTHPAEEMEARLEAKYPWLCE